jgi:hypothetical protein
VSLNRILTKDLIDDVRVNTIYFFSLSVAIVLACLVTHAVVEKSEFVQYHIGMCRGTHKLAFDDGEEERDVRQSERSRLIKVAQAASVVTELTNFNYIRPCSACFS